LCTLNAWQRMSCPKDEIDEILREKYETVGT